MECVCRRIIWDSNCIVGTAASESIGAKVEDSTVEESVGGEVGEVCNIKEPQNILFDGRQNLALNCVLNCNFYAHLYFTLEVCNMPIVVSCNQLSNSLS